MKVRLICLLALLAVLHLAHANYQNSQKVKRGVTNCDLARSANLTALSNGKKYSFHSPPAFPVVEWTVAKQTCAKLGLRLASILNETEMNLMWTKAQEISPDWAWWVSAENCGSSEFRWGDGSKLELDSPLWKDGADKHLECVFMTPGGKLSATECTGQANFICQLPSECY